jgi:predicted nucleic acid-binding protein
MKVVSLDTHILIWGIKEDAEPGQEHMIQLAKNLLAKLDEEKVIIIIPSIVLGEFLMRVPKNEHAQYLKKLEKRFIIASFDVKASSCFADLWLNKKKIRKEDPTCTRDHLKADMMIAAIAITAGSELIYSCDDHISKAAGDALKCSDVPKEDKQLAFNLVETVEEQS